MATQRFFAVSGRVALIDEGVYTIFRGDPALVRPDLPPYEVLDPGPLHLRDIYRFGWVSDEVPFMVLMPKHQPFYGTIFSHLNVNAHTIPIVQFEDGSWGLIEEVKEDWDRLERNLRALLSAMNNISTLGLPRKFRFWSYPMRYGYKWTYDSWRRARYICLRSRDAFVPLMASITFMLLLMRFQESVYEKFDWRRRGLNKTGIHHQWLADLRVISGRQLQHSKGWWNILHEHLRLQGAIADYMRCGADARMVLLGEHQQPTHSFPRLFKPGYDS